MFIGFFYIRFSLPVFDLSTTHCCEALTEQQHYFCLKFKVPASSIAIPLVRHCRKLDIHVGQNGNGACGNKASISRPKESLYTRTTLQGSQRFLGRTSYCVVHARIIEVALEFGQVTLVARKSKFVAVIYCLRLPHLSMAFVLQGLPRFGSFF